MEKQEKFILCECSGEGILMSKFDDEEDIFFSIYSIGNYHPKPSIWYRIGRAWRIIRKGTEYEDQIILSPENARELSNWLIENTKENG